MKGRVAVSFSKWRIWLGTRRQHHSLLLTCPAVSAGPCTLTSLSRAAPSVKWRHCKANKICGWKDSWVLHVPCYSWSNTGNCTVRELVHLEMITLSFTPTSPLTKVSSTLLMSFLMIIYMGKNLCRIILSLSEYVGHLASEVDKTMKKRAVLSSQGWVVGGFVWFCVGWGFLWVLLFVCLFLKKIAEL